MQRRSLAILAAMVMGVSALAVATPASAAETPNGVAYVALGDSEAAGTGLLPYTEPECLRSLKSYPNVLAPTYGGVATYACSGATTADAFAQVQTAIATGDLGPSTELVTITVGINDVGWQSVLLACSSSGSAQACQLAFANAMQLGQALPQRIAELVLTVRSAAPNAEIVVAGYPLLFGDLVAPCSIGSFQGTAVTVSPEQAALANLGVEQINLAIMAGALAAGATYVDIGAAFDGHGLCDTGDAWVSGLVNGKRTADRSLHLNWPGQRAYAAAIAAVV